MKLKEIIDELNGLNYRNQNSWFRAYELFKMVEEDQLYQEGYPAEGQNGETFRYLITSFSGWISTYCEISRKMSRNRAREILRAGPLLEAYLKKHHLKLNDLNLIPSPEVLANIGKLVRREIKLGRKEDRTDYYITEAIEGRLSRETSRQLLRDLTPFYANENIYSRQNMAQLAARDGSWLRKPMDSESFYKGFTSFQTPFKEKGVVIFENLTDPSETACHMIFIAPDERALNHLTVELEKNSLWSNFDYIWVLTPGDAFTEDLPLEIGLLKYSPLEIDMVRQAKKLMADTLWAYKEYVRKVH